jgi:hypothetical protein
MNLEKINPLSILEEVDFSTIKEKVISVVNKKGAIRVEEYEDGEGARFFFAKEEEPYNLNGFITEIVKIISSGAIERNLIKAAILANRKGIRSQEAAIGNYLYLTGCELYFGVFSNGSKEPGLACIIQSAGDRQIFKNEEIIEKIKQFL